MQSSLGNVHRVYKRKQQHTIEWSRLKCNQEWVEPFVVCWKAVWGGLHSERSTAIKQVCKVATRHSCGLNWLLSAAWQHAHNVNDRLILSWYNVPHVHHLNDGATWKSNRSKLVTLHLLWTMNACTELEGNPSRSCWDISLWTKYVNLLVEKVTGS